MNNEGFTLIELLIVIAIVGILTAIATPAYVGMQERGRIGAVQRTSNANVPELQGWINAVKKANTSLGSLTEVDTNGDGSIAVPDLDNDTLAANGMVTTFVASKADLSPWNAANPLWVAGGVAVNQPACDAIAAVNTGQISVCYTPAEDQSIRLIFIAATNNLGNIIYQKTVSSD